MTTDGQASSENAKYYRTLFPNRRASSAENRTGESQIKCHELPERSHSYDEMPNDMAIPEQISMVGFNDLPGAGQMVPRLTSVRTPRATIGQHAASSLLSPLDGRTPETPALDLGFELVVRESS